jgi:uncharacterized protein YcbK (DUF882 family)
MPSANPAGRNRVLTAISRGSAMPVTSTRIERMMRRKETEMKPTLNDLLYRIEKLEARVEELQTIIVSGLRVVVAPKETDND